MKKTVTMILTAALMLGGAGCSKVPQNGFFGEKEPAVDEVDIEELQSREGVMFSLSSEVVGPFDWDDDDQITGSLFNVYWDGTIERSIYHMASDPGITTHTLSESDYLQIYNFCNDAYKNNTYADYTETDVCDGETYAFTYYPADIEESFSMYYGYCYGNEDLMGIVDLTTSYFRENTSSQTDDEYTIDELKALSGNILTITVYDPGFPSTRDVPTVSYWIRCSGTIYRITHTSDGEDDIWEETTLTDEDYMTFYGFLCGLNENGDSTIYVPWEDDEYSCYVSSDQSHQAGAILYSGPIEEYDGLQEMTDLAASYFD